MDPGLVYDIEPQDYINYLCAMGYTPQEIRIISKKPEVNCVNATLDLNYPSFILILNNTNTTRYTFQRTLTNVGMSSCSYRVEVNTLPSGINVVVKPSMIFFEGKYSTAKFEVIVDVDISSATRIKGGYFGNSAYLSWLEVNGHHVVRSPIVSAIAA